MCCELQERVDEKATQASSRLWIVAVNSLHTSRTKKKRERVKKIRVSVTLGCSLRDEPIFSSLTRIFSRFSVPEKIFFPFRRKNLVYNIIRFSFAVFSCRTNENEINFIYFRTISRVKGFIRFFLSHKSFKHFVCYFFIQKRSASHAGSSNFLIKTFWMHGFERQDLRILLYIFTSIFLFSEFYSYQTSPSECPGLSFAAFCSSIYAIRNLVMLDKGMEKKITYWQNPMVYFKHQKCYIPKPDLRFFGMVKFSESQSKYRNACLMKVCGRHNLSQIPGGCLS